MTIALDYDGTYTLDPEFWDTFCEAARLKGHTVFCVTFRPEAFPVEREPIGCRIIYTNGQLKRMACPSRGIQIDVWIDDCPELIGL